MLQISISECEDGHTVTSTAYHTQYLQHISIYFMYIYLLTSLCKTQFNMFNDCYFYSICRVFFDFLILLLTVIEKFDEF